MPRWRVHLFALSGIAACASGDPPIAEPDRDAGTTHDAGVERDGGFARDAGDTRSAFERLVDDYDLLETVAGRGLIQTGGQNGWEPGFEGGAATEAELSRPHMALGDSAGNIYIADKDAHAIRRVDTSGVITTVAGTSIAGDDGDTPGPATARRLSSPNGLWVRADGTLYVYDLGNDKVRRVDTNGTMTTLFAVGGGGAGRGLWVSDDSDLAYVAAGTRLLRWRLNDGVDVLADGFVSIGNLHVAPDGAVFVADRLGHLVYRIVPGGGRQIVAGNGTQASAGSGVLATATGLDEVRGVWFHEGGFFVCTHKGGQVWFVDPDGVIHLFLDGDTDDTHAGDGQNFMTPGPKISEPRAVTMAPNGDVLVTESDFGFVRRIRRRP